MPRPASRSARRGGGAALLQRVHAMPSRSAHPEGVRATADGCVTCHMPKRRADDAPHVIMTDHLIQRRAPATALAEFPERPPEEYRGTVTPYYPSPLPETPRNALYRAVAQVGLGNNVVAGLPDLARLVDEIKPQEPEFFMVLGDGWKSMAKPREAAAAYQRALQIDPVSVRAMRALAEVDAPHAEQILARAVQIAPNDAESWFRYGVLTSSAERIRKAIALDPWLPDQSRRLAEDYSRGDSAAGCASHRSFRRRGLGPGRPDHGREGKIHGCFLRFRTCDQTSSKRRYTFTIMA